MGLFKKAFGCRACKGRVRQKPLTGEQLDMFGYKDYFYYDGRLLYVRSSKEGEAYESLPFEKDVFGNSSVDSSNECS